MAKRGRFSVGAGYGGVPQQIIDQIRKQAAGENTSNTGDTVQPNTTPAAAAKPDYSGLDFTGLDRQQINQLKKSVWSPEYAAERKAARKKKNELRAKYTNPFTAEQIAADPAYRAIKSGITLQQAIASYRQLVKAMNATPMEGQTLTTAQENKLRRLNASLTPQQKASQRIIGLLGGYGANPSLRNPFTGETYLENMYRRLGMDPSKVPTGQYQSPETVRIDQNAGPIISIPNPLSATQRARFQRLKAMNPKQMTARQKAAYNRLFNLKNSPKVLENPDDWF